MEVFNESAGDTITAGALHLPGRMRKCDGVQLIENPACSVCGEAKWRVIGTRTYALSDMAALNEYERARYRVLFEVWFPTQIEVELISQLCRECAFVTYTPRPSAKDIEEKYAFLSAVTSQHPSALADEMNRKRARLLYRTLKRRLPSDRKARVLDYGGGDGNLMSEFVANDCTCFLVDYSESVRDGVNRIGQTEEDLPKNAKFDLIVCSHVIEHVAEPLTVLRRLRSHLKAEGIIYIELPMEIWGAAPLHREPVTHVNFFTPASTRRLLQRAGFSTLVCKLRGYPHPSGRTSLCIHAEARPGGATPLTDPGSAIAEAERLLRPGFGLKLKRRMLMPSTIPGAFLYKANLWMKRPRGGAAVGGHRH